MDDVEKKQRPPRRTPTRTAPAVPVEVEDLPQDAEDAEDGEDATSSEEPGPAETAVEPGAPTGDGLSGDGLSGDGLSGDGLSGDGLPGDGLPGDGAAGAGRTRSVLFALIGGALVLLVVAGLVLSVIEWTSSSNRYNSEKSLRSSALSAATSYGVYLSSYNYKDLNGPTSPWAQVDSHSTPSFRSDFDSTKANLTSLVTDYKATATGKVVAAGLNSVSSTRAVALLFIDQTVTNTAQKPGTTTQPLRVELVLSRQHGKWLIDKLQVPS